jgi:carboxyl-terminal processing protease
MPRRRNPVALVLAALIPLVLLFGIWVGGHSDVLPGPVRDALTDSDDDFRVIETALERVHDDYYREVPRDQLANWAIDGAVGKLRDQFSAYLSPKDYLRYQRASNARFAGVGVTVDSARGGLRVVRVFEKSPARAVGIKPGDVIVAANGTKLAGKGRDAASSLIRGEPGTRVTLSIRRGKATLTKRVRRAEIAVPVVQARRRTVGGRRYAVIALGQFTSGAHGEIAKAARAAVRDKVAGIVLDLRHNPGGLVEEARLVASAFVGDGEIVTTRGRAVAERVYRATGDPVAPTTPMVVLVDEASASAAEIVAGALQDTGRARVVGQPTFGKGVFQEIVELPNGGALDITVGQYFTPKGRNLGGGGVKKGEGIKPDVRAVDKPKTRPDEALDRALAVLAAR